MTKYPYCNVWISKPWLWPTLEQGDMTPSCTQSSSSLVFKPKISRRVMFDEGLRTFWWWKLKQSSDQRQKVGSQGLIKLLLGRKPPPPSSSFFISFLIRAAAAGSRSKAQKRCCCCCSRDEDGGLSRLCQNWNGHWSFGPIRRLKQLDMAIVSSLK